MPPGPTPSAPPPGGASTAAEPGVDAGLEALRAEAVQAARRYAEAAFVEREFVPGETLVPVGGRVIGAPELEALVHASLDGWLTEGRFAVAFSEAFARAAGRSNAALVGSGSQGNSLAVAAMLSHLVQRPLKPGDEVITPAVGFPTTVNPIYQNGLKPVYVDIELDTFNPTCETLAAAISDRTRGIVMAHCLGNPFDGAAVEALCAEHGLHLVEDCCDALGSEIGGRKTGTFGQASTYSFYPAHHMTTGEGGAVCSDDPDWARAIGSLREWGRDCWCPTGVSDVCGRRFEGRFGDLPDGYDHKYVYSHVGFNFKVTDMQAALGLAQLERLDALGARRRANFARLYEALAPLADRIVLPRALPGADPSWFGFPFTLREGGGARRRELQVFLQERRVDSRLLLAGNMTRQPGYQGLHHRVAGPLPNADTITESSLWVGCYPALTDEMIDWSAESIRAFFAGH